MDLFDELAKQAEARTVKVRKNNKKLRQQL